MTPFPRRSFLGSLASLAVAVLGRLSGDNPRRPVDPVGKLFGHLRIPAPTGRECFTAVVIAPTNRPGEYFVRQVGPADPIASVRRASWPCNVGVASDGDYVFVKDGVIVMASAYGPVYPLR
jgi:hypothetical protein